MPLTLAVLLGCLTAALAPVLVTAGFSVQLTTTPSTVTEHLTKHLTVNCSIVADANSTITMPLSLTIKKSNIRNPNNFTDLAIANSINTQVFGSYRNNSDPTSHLDVKGMNSFLAVHWNYPVFNLTGSYMCELSGFTSAMHIETISTTTQVTDTKPDLVGALTELQKYEGRLTRLEAGLAGLTAFRNTLFLSTSQDGKYMVSRPVMRNSAVCEAICGLYGGYLAEFDTFEWEVIKNFLNAVANNDSLDRAHTLQNGTVMVGLTDEFVEGEWRFRAHPTHAQTSFTNWASGARPHTDRDVNCAVMDGLQGWRLQDVPCYDNQALVHFLCEMETH